MPPEASEGQETQQPEVLLAESEGGYTLSFQDPEQPNTSAPPSTRAPTVNPGTGGSGAQQAPTPEAPQGGSPTGSNPNTGATGNPYGGAGNTGTGANPNVGAQGAPAQGAPGTVPDPNADDGSPSADPNPESRGQDSNVNPGGTGNPGTDANAGTGGTGNGGTRAPAATPAPSPSAQQGIAVVDAIYTGVVKSVSSKEVVIVDDGTRLPLEIGTGTRILREGQAIGVNQLKEGEKVRAVVNIVGKSHTREIAVLSKAEARRAAGMRSR
ncbi:hypothetical protein D7V88_40325 [Corallococcus terminator]|uniref:DUF5666 domain-containing protein n=1 Tax=Corallococcus terminator TaxID=2316733 RepID=A0A3A8HNM1_9BACT|nr:hypothetical protein D7V88_40325 [Corallococcus terminator]